MQRRRCEEAAVSCWLAVEKRLVTLGWIRMIKRGLKRA